jgi:hypothetical protein
MRSLIYEQDCPRNSDALLLVEDHVRAHISSVVSLDDDEKMYYNDVMIALIPKGDMLLVRGVLPMGLEPVAPYLGNARQANVNPSTLASRIQKGLSEAGVPWRVHDGASRRGNGQQWGSLEGIIVHHTATASGRAPSVLWQGRIGLSGPLCNSAGEPDGTVVFVANYPANHAGASGGRGTAPLPATRTFNKRVWGHEIVYPGTSPMTGAQYRSAVILSKVVADIVGAGVDRIKAHAETSITGKWDPGYAPGRTIDMTAFRNAARTLTGIDMSLTPEERILLDLIYTQLAGHGSKPGEFKGWPTWPGGDGTPMTLVDYMRKTNVDLAQVKRLLADQSATIARQVVTQLTPLIRDAVKAAVDERMK